MSSQIDSQLVDKIVQEVYAQGVFDEFRRDSIADVDTKPAYQNLRQRVDNHVQKFLSDQEWTPDVNKIQLREKLRKHLVDSGFLDVGVERIVDQVVNPKIGNIFQPRIEDIAYKYLNIPKPPPKFHYEAPGLMHPLPPFPLTAPAPIPAPPPIPAPDLTVETTGLLPTDLEQISPESDSKSEVKEDVPDMDEVEEKIEEDEESPPFEPLEKCERPIKENNEKNYTDCNGEIISENVRKAVEISITEIVYTPQENLVPEKQNTLDDMESEKEVSRSLDAGASQAQESQLSQISSNSHLSTNSPVFTESIRMENTSVDNVAVNISEEAQMPKFSENSSEANGQLTSEFHFDIKQAEIKFEGTERKVNLMPVAVGEDQSENRSLATSNGKIEQIENTASENNSFKFTELNIGPAPTISVQESSFGSSLEDINSVEMLGTEKTDPVSLEESLEQKALNGSKSAIQLTEHHNKVEKEEILRQSSSSSRYKKHSKDRHRSREQSNKSAKHSIDNDRNRSKERQKSGIRSKDRSRDESRSRTSDKSKESHKRKHSSGSSKNGSLLSKVSDASGKNKREKPPASARHSTTSSSSSKSEGSDLKRSKYTTDKKHSSSSQKERERLGVDSSKKKQKKAEMVTDDHHESRDKLYRRRSSDSNDENKGTGGGSTRLQKLDANSGTMNDGNNIKSGNTTIKEVGSNSNSNQQHSNSNQHQSKVVFLNDVLQNPATSFIELDTSSNTNHILIQAAPINSGKDIKQHNEDDDLLYFEKLDNDQLSARLKLLNDTEKVVDEVMKELRSQSPETNSYPESKSKRSNSRESRVEKDIRKRSKTNGKSPTLSETSVNSKENDMLDKNNLESRKSQIMDCRSGSIKLSQQRYNSEDLYKPRPMLSQRSRRRGMDSIV